MRAVPAQRLLASHPATRTAIFHFGEVDSNDDGLGVDAITVFSPSMFLPAVIARAEAMAKFAFGSSEMMGVKRVVNEFAFCGVEADIAAIDGSPEGVLRSLLMCHASEQLFGLNVASPAPSQTQTKIAADHFIVVDLFKIRSYYVAEGAAALRGERVDILSDESINLFNMSGLRDD